METKTKYTINELVDRLFPIYFYRRHLDLAAKDLLGLNLAPHHRLTLRDWGQGKQVNMLYASRGMGKSVLLAIFYTLMAILYPKLKMLMVGGGGFRQSKFVLLEIEKIINCQLSGQQLLGYARNSLQDQKRIVTKDPSFWSIQFSNGSIIYAVPLGLSNEGSVIRGLRAHLLGQDEAFLIPSKLYQAVLEPMSNVLYDPTKSAAEQSIKNMSIMASTCDYSFRDFYKQYHYYKSVLENEESDKTISKDNISIFEFNIDDSFYLDKDGNKKMVWGLDYDKIITKRSLPSTDIELWASENKNIAMDISGGYFPFAALENCMNVVLDEKNEIFPEVLDSCSAPCILGIDTAPASANSAFVVIKVGMYDYETRKLDDCQSAALGKPCPLLHTNSSCQYRKHNAVIFAYEENKMSQKDRIKLIYELLERYNIIAIAMDARGGGYELADLLKDQQYIHSLIGGHMKPIYDPEYNPIEDGLPILKLYTTTQDDNMIMAGYLKGLITNTKILFPHIVHANHDNSRLIESYGHCETLVNQLARIKAIESGKGVKFEIESMDPETGRYSPGRKDLFSALMYSIGRFRELMIEKEANDSFWKDDLALPVGFKL